MTQRCRFSDRIGLTQQPQFAQIGDIDTPLRNSLWNWILSLAQAKNKRDSWAWEDMIRFVARFCWKVRVDDIPLGTYLQGMQWFRSAYDGLPWFEVYNLVEFLVCDFGASGILKYSNEKQLVSIVNRILEEELSGYRFIGGHLAPIASKGEVAAVEEVLSNARSSRLEGVATHIDTALALFSRKPEPDYRNSVKESISAVESAARLIASESTLKGALFALEKKGVTLHAALKQGFLALYGYTSDDDGIRHAILDEPTVGFDEAKYMLVTCSAFANFLIAKAAATGLLATS